MNNRVSPEITDPLTLRMIAEWDERYGEQLAVVVEQLKKQPCASCGSRVTIAVIPYGSIAKLTPMCENCRHLAEIHSTMAAGVEG